MRHSWMGLALAAVVASPVWAGDFTVVTDRGAFEAGLSDPYVVEDFGSTARFPITTGVLNSQTSFVPAYGPPILPGDIAAGVTYSTPVGDDLFFNIDGGGGFVGGFLDGFYGSNAARRLTVTFDGPASAFGFDTNTLAPNLEVVVTFSDNSTQSYSTVVACCDLSFYGFRSDNGADIVSATIGGPDNGTFAFAIDNFTFTATPVPEPSSAALLLLGLAAVGRRAVRRR